jgi:hypothetical protein
MEVGVTTLISAKKIKNQNCWKRWRKSVYNDKGSIQQKKIIILNLYAPNVGTSNYMKQILLDIKKDTEFNTILETLTPLSYQAMDHSKDKLTKKHCY